MKHLFVLLCVFTCAVLCAHGADNPSLPFSFDNNRVNQVLIDVYEKNPTIWQDGQVYLIGMCYVYEHRLKDARSVFEKLQQNDPANFRNMVALGNVYHMMGDIEHASVNYKKAWMTGKNVVALKQLAVLRLQQKDISGLSELTDDLLVHQKEELEIQKVLLSYSLIVEDTKKGMAIYVAVVRALDQDTVENNPELRKLLLVVTARYKAIEDEADSDRKAKDKVESSGSRAGSGDRGQPSK